MADIPANQLQELVYVRITKREAILIQKIRKYPYGQLTVHKGDGLIVRVEIKHSEQIETNQEISLE